MTLVVEIIKIVIFLQVFHQIYFTLSLVQDILTYSTKKEHVEFCAWFDDFKQKVFVPVMLPSTFVSLSLHLHIFKNLIKRYFPDDHDKFLEHILYGTTFNLGTWFIGVDSTMAESRYAHVYNTNHSSRNANYTAW